MTTALAPSAAVPVAPTQRPGSAATAVMTMTWASLVSFVREPIAFVMGLLTWAGERLGGRQRRGCRRDGDAGAPGRRKGKDAPAGQVNADQVEWWRETSSR